MATLFEPQGPDDDEVIYPSPSSQYKSAPFIQALGFPIKEYAELIKALIWGGSKLGGGIYQVMDWLGSPQQINPPLKSKKTATGTTATGSNAVKESVGDISIQDRTPTQQIKADPYINIEEDEDIEPPVAIPPATDTETPPAGDDASTPSLFNPMPIKELNLPKRDLSKLPGMEGRYLMGKPFQAKIELPSQEATTQKKVEDEPIVEEENRFLEALSKMRDRNTMSDLFAIGSNFAALNAVRDAAKPDKASIPTFETPMYNSPIPSLYEASLQSAERSATGAINTLAREGRSEMIPGINTQVESGKAEAGRDAMNQEVQGRTAYSNTVAQAKNQHNQLVATIAADVRKDNAAKKRMLAEAKIGVYNSLAQIVAQHGADANNFDMQALYMDIMEGSTAERKLENIMKGQSLYFDDDDTEKLLAAQDKRIKQLEAKLK